MPRPRHLSETRLHELFETGAPDPHLAQCLRCQTRLAELGRFVADASADAEMAFSQAMPEASIAAAERRVLAAIQAQPAGLLLQFPGARPALPRSFRTRPRWMVAAAAGLIVGLALGRWSQPGAPTEPLPRARTTRSPVQPAVYAVGGAAEDDLLTALESVHAGPIAELRSIHELTPLAEQHDTTW